MLKKIVYGMMFALLINILALNLTINPVKAQKTLIKEMQLFSYQINVPAREVRAPNIFLTEGTYVRIEFNASEPITFYCQDSWEYQMSASYHWSLIWYHWDDYAQFMNRTYMIPKTDTWYFTLANYEYHEINVYNITLYSLEIYEIHLASNKHFYTKEEQATLTVSLTKNYKAISGNDVVLQVAGPEGDLIYNQTKQTDMQGLVAVNFTLPNIEGVFTATARTVIAGETIEDEVIFMIDETPPTTIHNYDGLWHTSDLIITLTSIDEVSGVAEVYYRVDGGPIKRVGIDGHPYFHIIQAETAIIIDGNLSDWVEIGLTPIGTDPPDNIKNYNDISSDLLEAWAYTDLENLYLAMKVNSKGSYNFDRVIYEIYINTDKEFYKVKYYYWYDEKGYGYVFYWDEESGMWQARLPNIKAQAGPDGYIEWKVPFFDEYGGRVFDYYSGKASMQFTTYDCYYQERVNSIYVNFSLPEQFPSFVEEGDNHTLEYWSVDKAGNEELPHKILTGIKLDKTPPAGRVLINNDNAYTKSNFVILNLSAMDEVSGVDQMRFSNDGIEWSDWEPFATYKEWILTVGDGTKEVFVELKDRAGLIATFSDSIILDTTPPLANAGQKKMITVDVGKTVIFNASTSSDNIGIACYEWDFGDGTTEAGIIVTHIYNEPGNYTVTLSVRDMAGNLATDMIVITVLQTSEPPIWIIVATCVIIIITIASITVLRRRRKYSTAK